MKIAEVTNSIDSNLQNSIDSYEAVHYKLAYKDLHCLPLNMIQCGPKENIKLQMQIYFFAFLAL